MSRLILLAAVPIVFAGCGLSEDEEDCRKAVDQCEKYVNACASYPGKRQLIETARDACVVAADACHYDSCGTYVCVDELKRLNGNLRRISNECFD